MSISTVTSEALQLKLRQLLPSQQGFGTDLSASDTIIPVIDLTRAAEGSDTSETLQSALAFGSQTAFNAFNTTTVIQNTAGFYRIVGAMNGGSDGGVAGACSLTMTDGASVKTVYAIGFPASTAGYPASVSFDFTVFLRSGDSISAVATSNANIFGSVRQVADINGTLVQPVGFTPQ